MTPTSVTGETDRRARAASLFRRVAGAKPRLVRVSLTRQAAPTGRRQGFTLVELLLVVAILALAAGAVILTAPNPHPSVTADADRFAARLVHAREEAILSNRPVAVEATTTGYDFSVFDGERWARLEDGPFEPQAWTNGTIVALSVTPMRLVFDPTGVAEPATLTLSRDGRSHRVAVDGAGEVLLDG